MPKFDDIPKNMGDIAARHIQLYLDDPVKAHMWDGSSVGLPEPVPTLLLTSKGRKTGEERHVALVYVEDDGSYLIVASKGGYPTDPAWYLNLQATPECEIRVAAFRTRARARILEGAEREAAWSKITAKHVVYLKYQTRTDRLIPVVRLEPVAS